MKSYFSRPGATVIDVRTPEEFREKHAPGAINVPLGEVMYRIDEFKNLSKPILLYCQSGNRSGMAEMLLRARGIEAVHNVGGLKEVLTTLEAIQKKV